jgi:hypothetical protein
VIVCEDVSGSDSYAEVVDVAPTVGADVVS